MWTPTTAIYIQERKPDVPRGLGRDARPPIFLPIEASYLGRVEPMHTIEATLNQCEAALSLWSDTVYHKTTILDKFTKPNVDKHTNPCSNTVIERQT